MINVQKLSSILQIVGAALGIPAAVGGSYSVYKSYFSTTANCHALRTSLLATMDRALPADSIRALMKKDLASFATHCAESDPDAIAAFATLSQPAEAATPTGNRLAATLPAAAPDPKVAQLASPAPAAPGLYAGIPVGVFGIDARGETRGWIILDRRDQDASGQTSFDGYEIGKPLTEGAILRAQWAVPVWKDMQPPGPPVLAHVQGRLSTGQCVRILSAPAKTGPRPWAHAEPALCGTRF